MSHNKKISVIILSKEESWAEGLITTILGNNSQETQTENQIYTLVHIKCQKLDDFKDKPFEQNAHDMCLLVVERTFAANDVWQVIEHLNKKDKKTTGEFKAVLPLGYELTDSRIKPWTLPQLFIELDKLAEERKLAPIKGCGENTEAPTPTGGRSSKDLFTDHKKNLKRQHTATEVSLVLVGMCGAGKSASGNTILGKKVFMSKASSEPVTAECKEAETETNDKHVCVIDTPNIFDDDLESSDKDKHVKKCKELCKSDPCVYLLVMHVSRFTDGERDILTKLEKAFGTKVSEQTVILFTRGGDLQQAEMSLEDFLNSCQPKLKEIIEKCGSRCVVFENSKSDSDQVKKLMDTVTSMLENRQK